MGAILGSITTEIIAGMVVAGVVKYGKKLWGALFGQSKKLALAPVKVRRDIER